MDGSLKLNPAADFGSAAASVTVNFRAAEAHDANAACGAVAIPPLVALYLFLRDCVELRAVAFNDKFPAALFDHDVGAISTNLNLRRNETRNFVAHNPILDCSNEQLFYRAFSADAHTMVDWMWNLSASSSRAMKRSAFSAGLTDAFLPSLGFTERTSNIERVTHPRGYRSGIAASARSRSISSRTSLRRRWSAVDLIDGTDRNLATRGPEGVSRTPRQGESRNGWKR